MAMIQTVGAVIANGAARAAPAPRLRGEGRGEGQLHTLEQAAATHPNHLPILKKHGEVELAGGVAP